MLDYRWLQCRAASRARSVIDDASQPEPASGPSVQHTEVDDLDALERGLPLLQVQAEVVWLDVPAGQQWKWRGGHGLSNSRAWQHQGKGASHRAAW
jgi:hypothetical protein